MQISKILTTISILAITLTMTTCLESNSTFTGAHTHYTIDEMQAKAYDPEKVSCGKTGAMILPNNQWGRTTVCSIIPKM